jgi:mannose-1-phosphate guanylyltransferase
MKAFLLAAGIGSRLRPITDTVPKCMVTIDDRPLLDIWLDSFATAGVDEVLVNLHHLPDVVRQHVAARTGSPAVRLVLEPELLGSAGTLAANQQWVADEDFFLACNADNLTDFHSPNPSAGGVLELDDAGRVVGFAEKPAIPASDLVNAGMYAFTPALLDEIKRTPADIGYDLLPSLVGRARAIALDGYFRDIGTPEAYRRAREEWPVRAAP